MPVLSPRVVLDRLGTSLQEQRYTREDGQAKGSKELVYIPYLLSLWKKSVKCIMYVIFGESSGQGHCSFLPQIG